MLLTKTSHKFSKCFKQTFREKKIYICIHHLLSVLEEKINDTGVKLEKKTNCSKQNFSFKKHLIIDYKIPENNILYHPFCNDFARFSSATWCEAKSLYPIMFVSIPYQVKDY